MSDTKKAFLADLIKKDLAWCVKSRCVAAAKHKITSTCYIKSHICLKIHTKQKWFLKIIIIIIKKNRVQNNG